MPARQSRKTNATTTKRDTPATVRFDMWPRARRWRPQPASPPPPSSAPSHLQPPSQTTRLPLAQTVAALPPPPPSMSLVQGVLISHNARLAMREASEIYLFAYFNLEHMLSFDEYKQVCRIRRRDNLIKRFIKHAHFIGTLSIALKTWYEEVSLRPGNSGAEAAKLHFISIAEKTTVTETAVAVTRKDREDMLLLSLVPQSWDRLDVIVAFY